jgi:two-component system OmpR family response regulator
MGASTIVVVREDLSIPGAVDAGIGDLADIERHFFNVLRESKPDVILLDATSMRGDGIAAIGRIRQHSAIPVVVVCAVDDNLVRAYRVAGATECLNPPVEIVALNQLIQQIINSRAQAPAPVSGRTGRGQVVAFSGITFVPHEDLLVGDDGTSAKLTTSESRVLTHFIANPWVVCRREEIASSLYGRHLPNSDRAVDVIVTRLRKKMGMLAGTSAQRLIKTEFRRGYAFVADASVAEWVAETAPQPRGEVRFG